MRRTSISTTMATAVVILFLITGCGTPKESTAPCKRPAELSSYREGLREVCGPMQLVNADARTALAAIDDLARHSQ
jgi:hypothetical protein